VVFIHPKYALTHAKCGSPARIIAIALAVAIGLPVFR
jgi:hypothetical protein